MCRLKQTPLSQAIQPVIDVDANKRLAKAVQREEVSLTKGLLRVYFTRIKPTIRGRYGLLVSPSLDPSIGVSRLITAARTLVAHQSRVPGERPTVTSARLSRPSKPPFPDSLYPTAGRAVVVQSMEPSHRERLPSQWSGVFVHRAITKYQQH
ncbi:hypothetical protein N658DRAFT_135411 [Parathielavia hyrcaniae]|uniref:Uncharacterized protein n=1 Tax=Parathielavia hyrcaniae TaxID=113614 RepID=A0AAN6Q937_9PEZI|nr:hypothetical protein N658DRAFT_135411 [Parathielavia hyrcaniae]